MTTPSQRIAGIDQLRGVAVGLVMARHAFPSTFTGAGVVGVVMFFALSGYLITGVLLDEHERTGRVSFRAFYARRARRLLPALAVLVAGVGVVTLSLDPLGDRDRLVRAVLVALTWTGDLPFAHVRGATFHLWTLAVEEQFYLLWPAFLVVALARGRVGGGLLLAGGTCLAAAAGTVLWLRAEPDLAYALPTTWAVCFVVGAAARTYRRRVTPTRWLSVAALAGLAVLSVVPLRGHALTYLAGGPAIAILTAVLLQSITTTNGTRPGAALAALAWLGTVPYGAYLWNYPLSLWLRPHLDHGAGPLAAALTLLAAALSWRFVERPLARRRTPQPVPS